MLHRDFFIMMSMGAVFVILGIGAIIWGRYEEKGYYDSLATCRDLREYLEHWPPRPGLGALKVGGWIAVAVGLFTLAISSAFLLWR